MKSIFLHLVDCLSETEWKSRATLSAEVERVSGNKISPQQLDYQLNALKITSNIQAHSADTGEVYRLSEIGYQRLKSAVENLGSLQ